MIMKKTTYTTTRFDIDGEFYVEVSPDTDLLGREMFEFVLCKRNYGIKSFMVGLYKRDCPEDTWEEIIMENIKECIERFVEDMEYFDSI